MRTLPGRSRHLDAPVLAGGAALALALAGCSTVASGDLRTGGTSATIVVTAHDDSSDVSVSLSAGGFTSVELGPTDRLSATAARGSRATLTESSFLGAHSYDGTLPVGAPGTVVKVSFARGPDDTSAPRSTVALPDPIAVSRPRAGAALSRGDDLIVAVSDGAGATRVAWEGSCVETGQLDLDEGQPVVVPAGSITRAEGSPRRCTLTLTVSRVVTGALDPAYDGGSITALRSVGVAVTTTP